MKSVIKTLVLILLLSSSQLDGQVFYSLDSIYTYQSDGYSDASLNSISRVISKDEFYNPLLVYEYLQNDADGNKLNSRREQTHYPSGELKTDYFSSYFELSDTFCLKFKNEYNIYHDVIDYRGYSNIVTDSPQGFEIETFGSNKDSTVLNVDGRPIITFNYDSSDINGWNLINTQYRYYTDNKLDSIITTDRNDIVNRSEYFSYNEDDLLESGYLKGSFSQDTFYQNYEYSSNFTLLKFTVHSPDGSINQNFQTEFFYHDNWETIDSTVSHFYDDQIDMWIQGTTNKYYYTQFTSSVNDNPQLEFKIYPNPATEFITIEGEIFNSNYSIYDLDSRLMKSDLLMEGSKIYIGDLNQGYYFIKIDGNSSKLFLKL